MPARWLADHAHLLPHGATVLDVACGRGRNAIWLADRGSSVVAIDRNEDSIRQLQQEADARGLPVTAMVRDLEAGAPALGLASFDAIVVFHYLHRPLFPSLIAALRPGGLLIYETFTRRQAARGKPTNPEFLLMEGELPRLVRPLEILDGREGEFDERHVASVVARRR
jgi:SAM-dependent methyltransferase